MRPRRARLAWFAVNASGDCPTIWSATHFVNALASSQPSLGWSGTTTCKPLPPVVLAKLCRPIACSASRIPSGASVTRSHGQPLDARISLGRPLLRDVEMTNRGGRAFAEMLLVKARLALAAGAAHQGQ